MIFEAAWAIIGGWRGAIAAAAAVALTVSTLSLYDRTIDDPAVARAARAEYVARAELEAAKAKLAEVERQRDVAAQTLEEFRKREMADAAVDAETRERHEREISEYEAKLAAAGRSCRLDADDLKFLLEP